MKLKKYIFGFCVTLFIFAFIVAAGTVGPENHFTNERAAIQEIICIFIMYACWLIGRRLLNE